MNHRKNFKKETGCCSNSPKGCQNTESVKTIMEHSHYTIVKKTMNAREPKTNEGPFCLKKINFQISKKKIHGPKIL